MYCDLPTEAKRRTRREMQRKFWPVYFAYFVSWLFFTLFHPAHNSPLAYVLALCLSISMATMIITLAVVTTRRKDEFQRKLLMEAMLWGISGTLSVATVWGLLEILTNVPHLPIVATFPIFLFITATAKVTLFRRNRPTADE